MAKNPDNNSLSHIDEHNNPTMVDVSEKSVTSRIAVAQTQVQLPDSVKAVLSLNKSKSNPDSEFKSNNLTISGGEINSKKGPVFQTAIIAGVMAAKRTHELIPFCHPLGLENCKINIKIDQQHNLIITCECKVSGKTGVEMEALTGASVAALTVYDMCKALSHEIIIGETRLLAKSGGKSTYDHAPDRASENQTKANNPS